MLVLTTLLLSMSKSKATKEATLRTIAAAAATFSEIVDGGFDAVEERGERREEKEDDAIETINKGKAKI